VAASITVYHGAHFRYDSRQSWRVASEIGADATPKFLPTRKTARPSVDVERQVLDLPNVIRGLATGKPAGKAKTQLDIIRKVVRIKNTKVQPAVVDFCRLREGSYPEVSDVRYEDPRCPHSKVFAIRIYFENYG